MLLPLLCFFSCHSLELSRHSNPEDARPRWLRGPIATTHPTECTRAHTRRDRTAVCVLSHRLTSSAPNAHPRRSLGDATGGAQALHHRAPVHLPFLLFLSTGRGRGGGAGNRGGRGRNKHRGRRGSGRSRPPPGADRAPLQQQQARWRQQPRDRGGRPRVAGRRRTGARRRV